MVTKVQAVKLEATADSSGVGTAMAKIPPTGEILKISLSYDSEMSSDIQTQVFGGAVDSDVSSEDSEGYLVIDGNSNGTYYPRTFVVDDSGEMGSATYFGEEDVIDSFTTFNYITLKLKNSTDGKSVRAVVLYEEY